MSHDVHRYRARVSWQGSTGQGYEAYDRTHSGEAAPASPLLLSADPVFRGRPNLLNPEQLVVLAASSCQLLSFLAIAARARLDVVAYEDDADAVMPEDDLPVRLTDMWLRPRIVVATGDEERVRHYVERAHQECYIANSLRTRVHVEPRIEQCDRHDL